MKSVPLFIADARKVNQGGVEDASPTYRVYDWFVAWWKEKLFRQ